AEKAVAEDVVGIAADRGDLRAARADRESAGRLTEGTRPEMGHGRCSSARAWPRRVLVVTAPVDADIKGGYARKTAVRVAWLRHKGKSRNGLVVASALAVLIAGALALRP